MTSTHTPATGTEHHRFLAVLLRHLTAVDGVEQIPPDRALRMLGLNSMRAVDLVIDLEDAFDFQFPDEAFTDETFETAAGLWDVVAGLTRPAAP
jgi:acyl carrier protein